MTEDPIKKKLNERDRRVSGAEPVSEQQVTFLKRGLLILIFLGIGMLIVTAWFMTKRYWR